MPSKTEKFLNERKEMYTQTVHNPDGGRNITAIVPEDPTIRR